MMHLAYMIFVASIDHKQNIASLGKHTHFLDGKVIHVLCSLDFFLSFLDLI